MKAATVSNRYLQLMVRCFLGVVFIVSSMGKISAPEHVAAAVEPFKLLPVSFINIFALLIPWLELLCGIFLIAGVFRRASALILSALLCLFLFGILSAMMRRLHIDCG